jgi:hypothetical protein
MVQERREQEGLLRAVEQKFKLWRTHREKREPTPPELLADIHALSKTHNLYHLAKALRMNYRTVQKAAAGKGKGAEGRQGSEGRTKEETASFVEIPMTPLSLESSRMAAIEFETPWGAKARVTAGDDPAGRMEGWLKLLLMSRRWGKTPPTVRHPLP